MGLSANSKKTARLLQLTINRIVDLVILMLAIIHQPDWVLISCTRDCPMLL